MKCIYCSNDANYKDRTDGKCPSCRKDFAFEPKNGARYTDMAFKTAIDNVSSFGSVRFLPWHVHYELARKKRGNRMTSVVLLVLSVIAILVGTIGVYFFFLPAIGFLVAAILKWPKKVMPQTDSQFGTEWQRWVSVHGTPKGLIVRRAQPEDQRGQPPPDVSAYSFDRAVICDREETVDVLLANNFHFENNCAVLSVNGYPKRSFETVKAMLKKNPRLTVYVLHDATHDGCRLAGLLASDPRWFKGQARVVEVGMRPAHAKAFWGVWTPAFSDNDAPGLTKAEKAWLDKYSLELFAVRPEQVIKRLFQAISAGEADMTAASTFVVIDGGGEYYVDKTSFATDATTSDGGGDSFG